MVFRWGEPNSTSVEPEDAILLDRVRAGDRAAYGCLFERHHLTARAFARGLVSSPSDVDDVVAEVFAATLSALEHGKGPVGSFLPYLMRSVRNEAYKLNRRRRREPTDAVDEGAGRSEHRDPFVVVDEATVVRVAFRSLPANLREVLWRTEVDDATPTEIAKQRSATPHSVAMMALRARQAFGSAYLREHLAAESVHRDVGPGCREARPHLADFVRGNVGTRRRRRVAAHLETCSTCDAARASLGRLNEHLRLIPFVPLGLGHLGSASAGLKVQLAAWVTSSGGNVAVCGTLVTTALMPAEYDPPPPFSLREPVVMETATTFADVPVLDVGAQRRSLRSPCRRSPPRLHPRRSVVWRRHMRHGVHRSQVHDLADTQVDATTTATQSALATEESSKRASKGKSGPGWGATADRRETEDRSGQGGGRGSSNESASSNNGGGQGAGNGRAHGPSGNSGTTGGEGPSNGGSTGGEGPSNGGGTGGSEGPNDESDDGDSSAPSENTGPSEKSGSDGGGQGPTSKSDADETDGDKTDGDKTDGDKIDGDKTDGGEGDVEPAAG